MNYPKPDCKYGYTVFQVAELTGNRQDEFWAWMNGQTMCVCTGQRWDHDTESYVESCGGVAHGTVVYPWDMTRFLGGRPVVD